MKRGILLLLVFLTGLILISCCGAKFAEAAIYSIDIEGIEYTYDNMDELLVIIDNQKEIIISAQEIEQAMRNLGYSEDHDIIIFAQEKQRIAKEKQSEYQNSYNHLKSKWILKEQEYPVAAYIWKYLKDSGYSNYVCAGILGNMMTEAGGQTLDIQHDAISGSHYGVCQWSKKYHPDVYNTSLEEQCEYLISTIEYEIDTFGDRYKKNFDYSQFCALESSKQVAVAFARCYERPNGSVFEKRQDNAITAYNYFVT